MRTLVAVLVLLTPPLLAAPVPKAKKQPTLEEQLIGKWRMVASRGQAVPNASFHIVYQKDGEMQFVYETPGGGPGTVYTGKYTAGAPDADNKLGTIDWKINQGNGFNRGELSRITELTEDILEFKDPEGVVERFERVKEKKEEKKDK